MKKRLAIIIMTLCALTASANVIPIQNTRVTIDISPKDWSYLCTIEPEENTTIYTFTYQSSIIVSEQGDTVLPSLRICVRKNYNESTFDFAYTRYLQNPFQSLDEYVDGLPNNEGIGYIGAYTNPADGKNYQMRMIYFKDKNTAFEIKLETTIDTFEQMDRIFKKVLSSVKINK